jgi:nitrate/TMAO reductase-like tetraheme cytochrome c subunit
LKIFVQIHGGFNFMKKAMLLVIFVLAIAGFALGQAWTSPNSTDVLGAHNNNGRGCAGCHQPHSGAFGSGQHGAADSGSYALWGQDASPLYGASIAFGDNGTYTEVLPTGIATGGEEVGGILLCLSCHDGNVTPKNMMANQSYEQKIGLLTNTAYGATPIPTLLGNDGTTAGNYTNDHPVGQKATLVGQYGPMQGAGTGITYAAATGFVVTPGTPYAQFVANYGYPALAPGKWSNPYGVTAAGTPFVLCTTCHNQHVMTVYTSSAKSPIAGDGGGKWYATYFFVNGPYNPNVNTVASNAAPSTSQFCRQCHFGEANEANNTNTVKTLFQ